MKYLILFTVSALGLMQTACEMKIASDNVTTVNAPNSSVFGAGSIPPLQLGSAAPVTVAALPTVTPTANPSGITPITTPTTTGGGTIPMVPIKIASVQSPALSDAQKSSAVRASILNTFSNKSVSTFQLARNPASIQTQPVGATKSEPIKTASLTEPTTGRDPKSLISQTVESAR